MRSGTDRKSVSDLLKNGSLLFHNLAVSSKMERFGLSVYVSTICLKTLCQRRAINAGLLWEFAERQLLETRKLHLQKVTFSIDHMQKQTQKGKKKPLKV